MATTVDVSEATIANATPGKYTIYGVVEPVSPLSDDTYIDNFRDLTHQAHDHSATFSYGKNVHTRMLLDADGRMLVRSSDGVWRDADRA